MSSRYWGWRTEIFCYKITNSAIQNIVQHYKKLLVDLNFQSLFVHKRKYLEILILIWVTKENFTLRQEVKMKPLFARSQQGWLTNWWFKMFYFWWWVSHAFFALFNVYCWLWKKHWNLTTSQKRALHLVKSKFETQNCPFHLFLTGGAGVGKTYITKVLLSYIQHYCAKVPNSNPAVVCARIGSASNSINGRTLHSVFRISVFFSMAHYLVIVYQSYDKN